MPTLMKKVAIIQREIPHYRKVFFEKLSRQAKESGLDITVYCGRVHEENRPWTFQSKIVPITAFTGRGAKGPSWLWGLKQAIAGSDIIVAPHELQSLTVLYLWLQHRWLSRTWIWWGHGYDVQAKSQSNLLLSCVKKVKQIIGKQADGYIAYTSSGVEYWRQQGVAADRVFPYFNTLDVEGLRTAADSVPRETLDQIHHQLNLRGKRVLLYSGRLYQKKQVDFLLKAVSILQRRYPDVAVLILGDGTERAKLESLSATLNLQHVHFLGEQNDPVQASIYFQLADLLVLPCLVGLAIVHGFAHGVPLVTTDHRFHGPEIEYLSKDNGLMTAYDVHAYADGIQKILSDTASLEAMQREATLAGDRLALEKSVQHFTTAILKLSEHKNAMIA